MITWILSGLQAVLIILIILLVITQTVSVRIKHDERFILDFDLTLVSFSLIPDKKGKRSKSKIGKPGILSIIKVVNYALARSHLQIAATPQLTPDRDNPLAYGYAVIFKYIVLSYFDKRSISLSYSKAERSDYPLDVTFIISLYHLVCTLVLYFRECRKSRRKARARI